MMTLISAEKREANPCERNKQDKKQQQNKTAKTTQTTTTACNNKI